MQGIAFNAFLILTGIETLAIRMQKHCQNAVEVANFLNTHPKVLWVNHPSLSSSPYYELAKKGTDTENSFKTANLNATERDCHLTPFWLKNERNVNLNICYKISVRNMSFL